VKTLKDGFTELDTYSAKLSDQLRTLCYAGVAIIWMFKVGKDVPDEFGWDSILLWSLFLLVIALAVDLVQYFFLTGYWDWWIRKAEADVRTAESNGDPTPTEFRNSNSMMNSAYYLLYGKATIVLVGYCFLATFILKSLVDPPTANETTVAHRLGSSATLSIPMGTYNIEVKTTLIEARACVEGSPTDPWIHCN
jgi:hypothetical protein